MPASKAWRQNNRERRNKAERDRRAVLVALVKEHYGNKCACCGETDPLFLTIDHMNNDGAEHRRGKGTASNICIWLIRNNFPEGFQLMCYNCNCGRARNGGVCPHQEG